jgi:hypothetical protein
MYHNLERTLVKLPKDVANIDAPFAKQQIILAELEAMGGRVNSV